MTTIVEYCYILKKEVAHENMKKLLRSRDILLLSLGSVVDVFEEVKDPFQLLSNGYKNMYGWIPKKYKRHNYYQLISRSLKAQVIEKIEKEGEVYIRITSGGIKAIKRDFPMLWFQNRPWDKKWRIVMFDIKEVNRQARDSLRSKLKELGFGILQKSVLISPHDIIHDLSEFLETLGLRDCVYLLETSRLIFGDERRLVNSVWNIDKLNEEYKHIVEEMEKIKNSYLSINNDRVRKTDSKNSKEENVEKEKNKKKNKEKEGKSMEKKNKEQKSMEERKRRIRESYLRLIIQDPFLPKELLPTPWWEIEARRLIKQDNALSLVKPAYRW